MDSPATPIEVPIPTPDPSRPAAPEGRAAPIEVAKASKPIGPAHPRLRPRRRLGLGGTIFGIGLLAGLAWLTYGNATGSRALGEAEAAEVRGDFTTALRAAMDHLDRRPWSREASRIAARCLSRLDFAEEAEPYYRRGGDLAISDLRYRAYGLTRANLRERALDAFDDVLRRDPDDIAALRLKAGLLMSMTRWVDVGEIGRRLSASARRSAEADAPVAAAVHWTLKPMRVASVKVLGATLEAIALHNEGEVEDAVGAYEKVLALDPDLGMMPLDRRLFWSQFGDDLLSMGRSRDVIRHMEAADRGRADPTLVALLARAYTQLGSMDEAEACWRRVIEISPDHPAAWLNLGRLEMGHGRPEEAARLLARAASLAPESIDAAYNLGLTYRRLGQAAEAKKWEEQASLLRLRRQEKSRGLTPGRPSTSGGPPARPAEMGRPIAPES